MNHASPLFEVVKDIYEQEKGVGFHPDDTFIVWNNPDPSPEVELGFRPLVIDGQSREEFNLIKGHVYLGWGGDIVHFDKDSLHASDPYLDSFADRLSKAYERHDHQICLDGMATMLAKQRSTSIFTTRAHATGEIIKR